MRPRVRSSSRAGSFVLASLVPVACLCLTPPASGQTVSSLILLKPQTDGRATVDVVSGANRELARGKLLVVTDSALTLEGTAGTTEIPAAEVREVWSPGGRRYRKPLIIGAAVGLGLGLMAKAAEGDCNDPTSSCATDGPFTAGDVAITTALGTATGLGWAWWKRHPKRLLYLAPEPKPAPEGAVKPGAPVAPAAPPEPAMTEVRPDWLALAALRGRKIEVEQRGKWSTIKGPVVAVTPEAIQLLVDGQPLAVPQAEVRKVWNEPRLGWWHVPAGALYGTIGIGSLVTIAACIAVEEPAQSTCAAWAYGATAGTLGIFMSYGIALQRREALVYDSSRAAPARTSTLTFQPMLGRRGIGIMGAVSF